MGQRPTYLLASQNGFAVIGNHGKKECTILQFVSSIFWHVFIVFRLNSEWTKKGGSATHPTHFKW